VFFFVLLAALMLFAAAHGLMAARLLTRIRSCGEQALIGLGFALAGGTCAASWLVVAGWQVSGGRAEPWEYVPVVRPIALGALGLGFAAGTLIAIASAMRHSGGPVWHRWAAAASLIVACVLLVALMYGAPALALLWIAG
jgi:hypothetical protein